jgi:hypothetical protein
MGRVAVYFVVLGGGLILIGIYGTVITKDLRSDQSGSRDSYQFGLRRVSRGQIVCGLASLLVAFVLIVLIGLASDSGLSGLVRMERPAPSAQGGRVIHPSGGPSPTPCSTPRRPGNDDPVRDYVTAKVSTKGRVDWPVVSAPDGHAPSPGRRRDRSKTG